MSYIEDIRKRALIVEDTNEDFDASVPPSTGQEYIQRVVWEAARCEDVVVAEVGRSLINKQTFLVKNLPGCIAAPSEFAPSKEWQQLQVANFSSMRQKLARCRKKNSKHPPPLKLPAKENFQAWYKLCFGRELDEETTKNTVEVKFLPLLSIVTAIPHTVVEKMLEYEVEWLSDDGNSFTHEEGCWLYALLVALELPLTPDTCSLLRNLARSCSRLRAKLDSPDHPHVSALNLFICLVAKYFRQSDLAD